ncbi:hypothetical protein BHM03_00060651 [Ensete ventricosum]|nr:hypothetical protein BHM03_00060651 [Ensete ventricosum]
MRWGVHLGEPPASSEDASERDEDGFLVFSFDVANNDHETSTQCKQKSVVEAIVEICYLSKQDPKMCSPFSEAMPLLIAHLLNHHSFVAQENVIVALLNISISACKVLMCTSGIFDIVTNDSGVSARGEE